MPKYVGLVKGFLTDMLVNCKENRVKLNGKYLENVIMVLCSEITKVNVYFIYLLI